MNRLAQSTSPYLLQHATNPVDWWPWGPEAFAEAQRSGKPILLSVGYSACHWCHVMAHESFENESIAAVMNELFVSIKLDREERPDIDHLYMSALHALGEPGGWPLTMFLTPTGEPFWGGTYFPPTPRYGKPGFPAVLREISRIFHAEPEKITKNTHAIRQALVAEQQSHRQGQISPTAIAKIGGRLAELYDPVNGGLPGGPKFPNPQMLELLWRASRAGTDAKILTPFLTTLRQMARGGIHDHLGGGFARYAVDDRWLVPHFEKMLYDNAQLLPLYGLAYHATREPIYRHAAEGIVEWLVREMLTADGAFAASMDADSEGEEGRYYVWTEAEIDRLLGKDAAKFKLAFGVSEAGNWEGKNILNQLHAPTDSFWNNTDLENSRKILLNHRASRIPPGRDDKILADWNGLMITGLVQASAIFARPAWLTIAKTAYDALKNAMRPAGEWQHGMREARFCGPALALDHAALGRAALALYEAFGDPSLLEDARSHADILHERYRVADSGILAMSAANQTDIILRPQPTTDDAIPNANAVYADLLARLVPLTGERRYQARIDAHFTALAGALARNPIGHCGVLSAFDQYLHGASIVILGRGAEALALVEAAKMIPFTERVILTAETPSALPADHPIAMAAQANNDRPQAYICIGQTCSLPVSEPREISERLAAMRGTDLR